MLHLERSPCVSRPANRCHRGVWLIAIGLCLASRVQAADAPTQRLICPIDGAVTFPVGNDGRPAPRTYSDLETPTEAYTNLVVACPKCGYANWTGQFQSQVDGATTSFVRAKLTPTANRAWNDPVFAYRHMLQLLEFHQASLRERIGALLFYTYVLKRKRPMGGQDPDMEREIQETRKDVIALLVQAMRIDPPLKDRGVLEWRYLIGELTRLVGQPAQAEPMLRSVCENRDDAGYLVGRLACEMATRAQRKETFEDYRDGVFDIQTLPPKKVFAPPAPAQAPADPNTPPSKDNSAKPPAAGAPPAPPAKPLPPMARPESPRPSEGGPPPPPPPAGP